MKPQGQDTITPEAGRIGPAPSLTRIGTLGLAAPLGAIAFFLGITASAIIGHFIAEHEHRRHQAAFDRTASEIAATAERQFRTATDVLRAMRAHVLAVQEPDVGTFTRFVERAIAHSPALSLLEWAPLVTHDQREAFEQARRDEGIDGFRIVEPDPSGRMGPAATRAWYVPLTYIVPPSPDALGFDLGSEPRRRDMLEHAATLDTPLASERFRMIEDDDGDYSVAIYLAVHQDDGPEPVHMGYVIAIYRLEALLDRVLGDIERSGLTLQLEDRTGSASPDVLYRSAGTYKPQSPLYTRTFDFGERQWALTLRGEPLDRLPTSARQAFLIGLLLALLLSGAVFSWGRVRGLQRQIDAVRRFGQYHVLEKLGSGGMGAVYRAEHALMQRQTAVKVLRDDGNSNASALKRFEKEVRLTAKLRHPNTISVFDYGRTSDGSLYYAMEMLNGLNLHELVAQHGPLHPGRVVHILQQCCGSLAEAHDLGLLHRDIKPENIMLLRLGRVADFVKVLDFGLVREMAAPPDARVTQAEIIMGTPHYMAPETIRGETIDGRSDLYALGCVGYFLLCGRRVFSDASALNACMSHLMEIPRPPSERGDGFDIPPSLEELILQLLSKKPDARPASAADVRAHLRSLTDVPPWTEEDAIAWWDRHVPGIGINRPVDSGFAVAVTADGPAIRPAP